MGRVCTKCEELKPLSEFHKDKHARGGYTVQCKLCRNTRHQEYRKETNYEKDHEHKAKVRSNPDFVKEEYKKHTEWGRKNAKKLAEQEAKRRNKETPEDRKIRLQKMKLYQRKIKYR